MKPLLTTIPLLILLGCTSIPKETETDIGGIASVLGIDASQILYKDAVAYAITEPGEQYARFELGMYIQTSDQVMFARYSEKSGKLFKEVKLPFTAIRYAGVATRGMFNHLQQLRFLVADRVISVNFNNSSDAEAGYKERTQNAVNKLKEKGVLIAEDSPWVYPSSTKDWSLTLPLIIN